MSEAQKSGLPSPIMSLPAGVMFEVDASLIDEGKFVKRLNETLKVVTRDILEYWRSTGDTKNGAKINVGITLAAVKDSTGFINIRYKIDKKLPTIENASIAMLRGDKLLCQPVGTNKEPEQLVMYDMSGRPVGKLNTSTGETSAVIADQFGGQSSPVLPV